MKIFKPSILLGIFTFTFLTMFTTFSQAQTTASEEAAEQREFERERQEEMREEMQRLREREEDIKQTLTAEDVLEKIKTRAQEKIKERRQKQLLKTRISAGTSYTYDLNPLSGSSGTEKEDGSLEETFSFKWVPTFTKQLNGNFGYSLTNLDWFRHESINTFDHSLNADLTYKTLKNKLNIAPGMKYQWLLYPFDDGSRYDQIKNYLNLTYYWTRNWNIGGKYEYSYKYYPKKAARDEASTNLNFSTVHNRNTFEFWVKRLIGKYSIKVKGKSFRNKSNDEYQDFNDYDAHKIDVTFSAGFGKLYLTFTTDYEIKQYFDRIAVDTARHDEVSTQRLSATYTLPKNASLNYTLTYKDAESNASTGDFKNLTNKLGVTVNF